jgi:hypothetical protein
MVPLYADEHFPAQAVEELRNLGHDVRTVQEDGQAGLKWPDSEILRRATELGRAVLTLNRRDFIHLHNQNPNHSGIVACTQNLDFAELAKQIHIAIVAEPTLVGYLIRVYRSQARA